MAVPFKFKFANEKEEIKEHGLRSVLEASKKTWRSFTLRILFFENGNFLPLRLGIEPRSPTWQAGILTTILTELITSPVHHRMWWSPCLVVELLYLEHVPRVRCFDFNIPTFFQDTAYLEWTRSPPLYFSYWLNSILRDTAYWSLQLTQCCCELHVSSSPCIVAAGLSWLVNLFLSSQNMGWISWGAYFHCNFSNQSLQYFQCRQSWQRSAVIDGLKQSTFEP